MRSSEDERRAIRAYGIATLIKSIGLAFVFGALFSLAIGRGGVEVPFVLCLLAVACLVVAKFVTAEFDE